MRGIIILWLIAVIAVGYGYINNIVTLIGMDWDAALTIEAVLRIIGIVAGPLGVVMGYL